MYDTGPGPGRLSWSFDGLDPSLDPGEGRDALIVQDDEFSVEHDLSGAEGCGQSAQLGNRSCQVVAVAAGDGRLSVHDPQDGPDPVPLELVGPLVGSALGERAGGGEHGRDRSGRRRRIFGGGPIRWIIHWPGRVGNSAYRPSTRSPWRITFTSRSVHVSHS